MNLATYFMEATYLIASVLFVLALKGMSHPETARRGMFLAEGGMFAAIVGTLVGQHIVTWVWIIAGLTVGSIIHLRFRGPVVEGVTAVHPAINRGEHKAKSGTIRREWKDASRN